ncbi:hypothetical protein GCM10010430_25610 [Kitasatospora cystarginea]|uniref:Uncharacterized protein n=1 Tax=Kitasatospora cystarginea TaxID=58350 RepID=A0ABN3DVX2_9ACTN
MTMEGARACPVQECDGQVELSAQAVDGVWDWRCLGCGAFGYTLPPGYAAAHPGEQFLQLVGRRVNASAKPVS